MTIIRRLLCVKKKENEKLILYPKSEYSGANALAVI